MSQYDSLVEFLQSELGDALQVVVAYEKTEYEVLHETRAAQEYLEDVATKSADEIHEDFVLESMKSTLDEEDYGGETFCKIFLSDLGTTFQLLLDETEGLFFTVEPVTDLTVPSFVERCLDRV